MAATFLFVGPTSNKHEHESQRHTWSQVYLQLLEEVEEAAFFTVEVGTEALKDFGTCPAYFIPTGPSAAVKA